MTPDLSHLTLGQLENRARAAERWLGLPFAHLWADMKADEEEACRMCRAEIARRRHGQSTNPVKAAPLPAPLGAGDFPLPPAPDPLREGVEA